MENSFITSEFINTEDFSVDSSFTAFTEIESSGFNRLVKARRYGKWFLLKGLKPEFYGEAMYRQLLMKEFEIGVTMSHKNIINIYGWENVPELGECIVMEYIEGVTLEEFLGKSPDKAVRKKLTGELIDAVKYISGHQIVHRDIKPANIMVTTNGSNLKIIDFGLSDTDFHDILKEPAGTPKYMSEEQKTSTVPDVRNDIYCMGKILVELNAGWKFTSVGRKCSSGLSGRYRNMDEVANAVRNREILSRTSLSAVLAVAVCALLIFNSGNMQEVNRYKIELTETMQEMTRQKEELTGTIQEITKQNEELISLNQEKGKKQKQVTEAIEYGKKHAQKLFDELSSTIKKSINYDNPDPMAEIAKITTGHTDVIMKIHSLRDSLATRFNKEDAATITQAMDKIRDSLCIEFTPVMSEISDELLKRFEKRQK